MAVIGSSDRPRQWGFRGVEKFSTKFCRTCKSMSYTVVVDIQELARQAVAAVPIEMVAGDELDRGAVPIEQMPLGTRLGVIRGPLTGYFGRLSDHVVKFPDMTGMTVSEVEPLIAEIEAGKHRTPVVAITITGRAPADGRANVRFLGREYFLPTEYFETVD